MPDFAGTLIFSLIMGSSIFLSLPIILRKKTGEKTIRLLNAVAIGILVFLLADVFSNVASSLYAGGSFSGYVANPSLSLLFATGFTMGFFMLYIFENRSKNGLTPQRIALMIAMGMGLQNLTEGLVFGALSASFGLFSGVALVVLLGFLLQNITEGFPITSPFLNHSQKKLGLIAVLLLVGGFPTVIGGMLGFYFSSVPFNIFVDGLAVGAILYVILPMAKHQLKDIDPIKQKLVYTGIFLGFLIGFLVNLI